jgi:putative Mn2+ efflux pump MntP
MLILMSIGTSIDALAVGLSLALAGNAILMPSLVIGVVAAGMTYVGLKLGRRLGVVLGRPAQFVGGLVLIAIGLQILASHLEIQVLFPF